MVLKDLPVNSLFVVGLLISIVSITWSVIYLIILKRREKKAKNKLSKQPVDVSIAHITAAGTNIFLELGFPPEEAERLLKDVNRIIAERKKKQST